MPLALRQATEDDVAYLAALAADPEIEPFLSFAAADEDRLLALLAAPGPAPGSGGLLVIESADGAPFACRHALHDHDMHRVQAECYGDNPAAHRLFERAGFTREGTRRRAYWRRGGWLDGVLFGLLAEELSPEALQAG
jgi:RimJ/RimL family protein N-acetyltransferase